MAAAPTSAITALIRAGVPHTLHPYHHDPRTTAFGDEAVSALGWDPTRVFKTLIASVDDRLVVAVLPVGVRRPLPDSGSAPGLAPLGSSPARRPGEPVPEPGSAPARWVRCQLDLKALAGAVNGRKARMADVADAERSSGYVAGGISPLGQRRRLPTVVDVRARSHATILVSAGRRGLQVEVGPADLIELCHATEAHLATGYPA